MKGPPMTTKDLSHIEPGLRPLAVPISELTPYPGQTNTHPERNIAAIARSLRVHGQKKSIVANRMGEVVAGWGTVLAAQRLGWEQIAVIRSDEDDKGLAEFHVEDNRTADLAQQDEQKLLAHLKRLGELGSQPDELGWTAEEMAALRGLLDGDDSSKYGHGTGGDAPPQEDRVEELRKEWGVETGQLWKLGEHRLLCGDAFCLWGFGTQCRSVIFDPEWDNMSVPENNGYQSLLAFCDGGRCADVIKIFGPPTWVFVWDCVASWFVPNRPLRRMKLSLWYGDIETYKPDGAFYGEPLEEHDGWNSRGGFHYTPDPRGKHLSDLFKYPITTIHHADNDEIVHQHSKPADWVRMLIGNCTDGDVFDPFAGSGTTIIACEQLGRKCRAIEISPGYVAVILRRYLDATGKTPELVR
jgi:hypothetical protein